MASRRDTIQMTDAEVKAFLGTHKTIIINSNGPGGYPHPMPMWFSVDDDGQVRMTTFRKSQKVRNIQRDPRVSLLVEAGREYNELQGVVLYGNARVVDELEEVKRTLRTIGGVAGGTDPAMSEAADRIISATASKRVAILIRPEKTVSWDHRKLGGTY